MQFAGASLLTESLHPELHPLQSIFKANIVAPPPAITFKSHIRRWFKLTGNRDKYCNTAAACHKRNHYLSSWSISVWQFTEFEVLNFWQCKQAEDETVYQHYGLNWILPDRDNEIKMQIIMKKPSKKLTRIGRTATTASCRQQHHIKRRMDLIAEANKPLTLSEYENKINRKQYVERGVLTSSAAVQFNNSP